MLLICVVCIYNFYNNYNILQNKIQLELIKKIQKYIFLIRRV